jgi:hypothetical protein
MGIHTSAITYRRGIPNNYVNFYLVSQANNVIPSPMSRYINGYQFYNRNISNLARNRWPWRI